MSLCYYVFQWLRDAVGMKPQRWYLGLSNRVVTEEYAILYDGANDL